MKKGREKIGPGSDSRGFNSICNVVSFKPDITKRVFIILFIIPLVTKYYLIITIF